MKFRPLPPGRSRCWSEMAGTAAGLSVAGWVGRLIRWIFCWGA